MKFLKLMVLVFAFAWRLAPAAPLKNLTASGWAEVNGGRLYYEVYGQGAPLVYLHAGLVDSRAWDGQVKYFSRKYTVVHFDARGYGKSDPPTGPYAPAEDLYFLLKFLNINRAFVIGLSIGGTYGIDFAIAHPEMVTGLAVVAASPGWLPYSDAFGRRLAAIGTASPESIVEGWMNDPMLAAARANPRIANQMRMFLKQNVAGIRNGPLMGPPKFSSIPKLSDLLIPTLVIVGERDDPEIVERSRMISSEIRDAREVIIKGADHMVNIEKPREFNRALDEFLNGVKRR
jgi:pimeloyl-ACP methyl ester carboxylesterase